LEPKSFKPMKILSTKIHACLDYSCAIIMICSSLLFQLSSQEYYILFLTGCFTLLYNAITNHEFAVIRLITMSTHFKLDFLSGMLLITIALFFPLNSIADILLIAFGCLNMLMRFFSHSHIAPTHKYPGSFPKQYDMPIYGKMEKFPRMKI
jgi:hypothetical protein